MILSGDYGQGSLLSRSAGAIVFTSAIGFVELVDSILDHRCVYRSCLFNPPLDFFNGS